MVKAISRCAQCLAVHCALNPILKPGAIVTRTDHDLRTEKSAAVAVDFLDDAFASDLKRTVSVAIYFGHVFTCGRQKRMGLSHRAVLRIAVNAHGAHENITLYAGAKEFRAGTDLSRSEAAGINADIPVA